MIRVCSLRLFGCVNITLRTPLTMASFFCLLLAFAIVVIVYFGCGQRLRGYCPSELNPSSACGRGTVAMPNGYRRYTWYTVIGWRQRQ